MSNTTKLLFLLSLILNTKIAFAWQASLKRSSIPSLERDELMIGYEKKFADYLPFMGVAVGYQDIYSSPSDSNKEFLWSLQATLAEDLKITDHSAYPLFLRNSTALQANFAKAKHPNFSFNISPELLWGVPFDSSFKCGFGAGLRGILSSENTKVVNDIYFSARRQI